MEQNFQVSNEEKLYNQIEEAYGNLVYTYTTHVIYATSLCKNNKRLRIAKIILSAIVCGGIITEVFVDNSVSRIISIILSLLLLIITSYFNDSILSESYTKHTVTAHKLRSIREMYISLLTDYNNLSYDEIIKRRDTLIEKTSDIYSDAPLTDNKAYTKAQKALKDNEQQYFSREDLNKILPETLRK